MSETVFVEEYRKELAATGYPFTVCEPIVTDTGLMLPLGAIIDASVYFESPDDIPALESVEKTNHRVTFAVGPYRGTFDLRHPDEVIQLRSELLGIFGGILVCDLKKIQTVQSWRNGVHAVKTKRHFCPRCLELIPPTSVQRLVADTNEVFSGDVIIVSGKGGVIHTETIPQRFSYVQVHFTGDPTQLLRENATEYTVPVQSITCTNPQGESVVLAPNTFRDIRLVACNTTESNFHEDALRIDTLGSTIRFSLADL